MLGSTMLGTACYEVGRPCVSLLVCFFFFFNTLFAAPLCCRMFRYLAPRPCKIFSEIIIIKILKCKCLQLEIIILIGFVAKITGADIQRYWHDILIFQYQVLEISLLCWSLHYRGPLRCVCSTAALFLFQCRTRHPSSSCSKH